MGKIISESTKEQILSLYRKKATPVEIATKLKLSTRTVENVLVRTGKMSRSTGTARVKPSVIAQRKRAAWLKGQGWSMEQVCRATGLKSREINENWRDWAEKYGIKLPEPANPPSPGVNGPVITYRMVDGHLVRMEESVNPVTNIVSESEYLTLDDSDPISEFYRKIIEEGGYEDE